MIAVGPFRRKKVVLFRKKGPKNFHPTRTRILKKSFLLLFFKKEGPALLGAATPKKRIGDATERPRPA
jgi:hypothetical protein